MKFEIHNSEHFANDPKGLDEFLTRIHELDVETYEPGDQGTKESMVSRFASNEKTFIYLTPEGEDKVIGYMNFFPVSDEMYAKIIDPRTPYEALDDEITPEDVVKYRKRGNNVFIISILISKNYRGKEAATALTDGFVEYLRSLGPESFNSLTACTVSPDGRKFLSRLRFRFHHSVYFAEDWAANDELNSYDFNSERSIYICDNEDDFFEEELDGADSLYIPDETEDGSDPEEIDSTPLPGSLDHGGSLSRMLKYGPYAKTYHDDIYLIMPLSEHPDNEKTNILFNSKPFYVEGSRHTKDYSKEQIIYTDDDITTNLDSDYYDDLLSISEPDSRKRKIAGRLVTTLRDCIEYECSNSVASELDILYLGCFTFLHTTDQYPCDARRCSLEDEIVVGAQDGYVLLTAHRKTHLYSLTVYFPDYKYSTSQLEDQLSNNYVKVIDPRDKSKWIRLYDYLADQYYLHKCGEEKVLLCMSGLPKVKNEMQNILSAEVFNSAKLPYHIDSKELKEKCEVDHAQYDYYQVYLSSKVIAFIPYDYFDMDINGRIDITATYSFIAELVIFQNTSLARMNIKVTRALEDDGDVSLADVLELDKQYGQTIPFWDPTNFKYYGTQQEASKILNAFSNEELKQTYNEYQEFLEHIVNLQAEERGNRNDLFLNIAATVLAILQVQDFLVDLIHTIYTTFGVSGIEGDIDQSVATGDFKKLIFSGLFAFILIAIVMRQKKKSKKIKITKK